MEKKTKNMNVHIHAVLLQSVTTHERHVALAMCPPLGLSRKKRFWALSNTNPRSETPGRPQDPLERWHLTVGLITPWNIPRGTEIYGDWGEKAQPRPPLAPVATATSVRNKQEREGTFQGFMEYYLFIFYIFLILSCYHITDNTELLSARNDEIPGKRFNDAWLK